ncbi:MAG: hypothetical protein JW969_18520 [Spirochaetales bacterium]|nr:hypothetical protein [Spirochaetales bacterium]
MNRILPCILLFLIAAAGCQPGKAVPIAYGNGRDTVPAFIGSPAMPNPLPEVPVPAHPYLARQGLNGMHADSYCTGAYPWSGPLGRNPQIVSASLAWIGGEAATVAFDGKGRLVCVSGNIFDFQLLLLDPVSLDVIAVYSLPQRASMARFWTSFDFGIIMNDTSGGAYCHLGSGNRPIIATADRKIRIFALEERGDAVNWIVEKEYDLAPCLDEEAAVTDAMPDWLGHIWFITRQGDVGYVDPDTSSVYTVNLPSEEIQNAMAISEDGVFIVSDHALYRFEIDPISLEPRYTFRETYDRGTSVKPGSINRGSGTTPTLVGRDLVAITDNADERVNVLVYKRLKEVKGSRLVLKQPVFDRGRSVSENSLIAYGLSLIVENNYLYSSGLPTDPDPRGHPGIVRIDINPDYSGGRIAWESRECSPTTVPKLSMANGLVYLYTRLTETPSDIMAWYLTALDFRTGKTVFKIFTGTGQNWNNNYAPITLGPDGTAYVGCYNGIMAIRDSL